MGKNILWTPGGSGQTGATIEVDDSQVMLHDSDILAMEKGPLAYARSVAHNYMEIDEFVNRLTEQFQKIGLYVDVEVWQTNVENAWLFKVIILKRLNEFDPDQQVQEQVRNILSLPGEEGFINTGKAMAEMERERRERGHGHQH